MLLLALPAPARADADFEAVLVDQALVQQQRQREPEPEGKRVEEVLVSSENIISSSDPYPGALNYAHVKTREHVIRREVLLQVGQPYSPALAEETERNLRRLLLFSAVKVVPLVGRAGGVGILVVTKDVWSIRFSSSYTLVGPTFLYLHVSPTEENLLGLGKQLSLDYILDRGSHSIGQIYADPHVLGTHLALREAAALILNRQTGHLEGSQGSLSFGLPLYTLDTPWGFSVVGDWAVRPVRRFKGTGVEQLPYPSADAPTAQVPNAFQAHEYDAMGLYTRSFGHEFKRDLSVGLGGYSFRYQPLQDAGLTPAEQAWYAANHLPRSEDALFLQLSARLYQARYARLRDRDLFALSEDYQLGYAVVLRARWAPPSWLSPTRYTEGLVGARYRWLLSDDLLTVAAVGGARNMPDLSEPGIEGPWVNQRLAAEVQNQSPWLGPGRLVVRGLLDMEAESLSRDVLRLGGGNGLRGLQAEALSGQRLLLYNVEYRTRAFEWHTLYLGLVFFYDGGSAYDVSPQLVHTVGLGIRIFPLQFFRQPFRLDFGWVINAPAPAVLDRFSASLGQVTDFRPSYLDRFD